MTLAPAAFRYSGSKRRLVSKYPIGFGPEDRIVEPYLGSGAFSIYHSKNKALGYEINKDLYSIWDWLHTCSESDLHALGKAWEYIQALGVKGDLRDIKSISDGARNYLRVNISGLMVGQLSSWISYPQHNLPWESTVACLERIKEIQVLHKDGLSHVEEPGDFFFLDPPYVGTSANYMDKSNKTDLTAKYDPRDTVHFLDGIKGKWLMTYGDGCQEVFPEYKWIKAAEKKVPLVRTGGIKIRGEWYACNY